MPPNKYTSQLFQFTINFLQFIWHSYLKNLVHVTCKSLLFDTVCVVCGGRCTAHPTKHSHLQRKYLLNTIYDKSFRWFKNFYKINDIFFSTSLSLSLIFILRRFHLRQELKQFLLEVGRRGGAIYFTLEMSKCTYTSKFIQVGIDK